MGDRPLLHQEGRELTPMPRPADFSFNTPLEQPRARQPSRSGQARRGRGYFRPGDVLLGRYRVERVLGVGGMGVVVCARHLYLDHLVAIKTLLPEAHRHKHAIARFYREARAATRLQGEHVGRVLDVDRLVDGTPCMIMEYLEGTDLRRLLKARGRLSAGVACDWILQACEALAEAHAAGIVHRDVKPSNCFLARDENGVMALKLIDFGISKMSMPGDETLTDCQMTIGTPHYMSPEQIRSGKDVDGRTDIWSLAVVLYELLTGTRPFVANSYAGLFRRIMQEPMIPLPSKVPASLARVIACCLAKDPETRFGSMAELAMALAPHARTPAQATRSRERTAHFLGIAPLPLPQHWSEQRAQCAKAVSPHAGVPDAGQHDAGRDAGSDAVSDETVATATMVTMASAGEDRSGEDCSSEDRSCDSSIIIIEDSAVSSVHCQSSL